MTPRHRFAQLLRDRLRQARLRGGGGALLQTAALLLPWLGTCLLLLGWPGEAAPAGRIAVLLLVVVGAALIAAERVGPVWHRLRDRRRFSRALDRATGAGNLLVAAEEALRRPGRWRGDPVATAAADAVAAAAARRLEATSPGRALRLPGARPSLALLIGAVLLSLPALLLDAPVLVRGWQRLQHPLSADWRPPRAGLYLVDGPGHVRAHADLELAALDFGTPRGPVRCELREGDGPWRSLAAEAVVDSVPAPCRHYRVVLRDVVHDLTYRFRRDGMQTPVRTVRVLRPPLLTHLAAVVTPPAYTGLPADTLPEVPAVVEALAGSHIRWRGVTNHPVTAAAAVTSLGDTVAWTVSGDTVRGEQRAERSLTWSLALRDTFGLTGGGEVHRRLTVLPDRPPTARLRGDRENGGVLDGQRLELAAGADDDFGLSRLELLVRREAAAARPDTSWQRITLWSSAEGARRGEFTLPGLGRLAVATEGWPPAAGIVHLDGVLRLAVGGLSLLPGDALALCLEAVDNRPSPPGRGRSAVLRLVVPGRTDLLAGQLAAQDSQQTGLEALRREGEAVAEDLARLERQLRKDPAPDFARRQEIAAALQKQQELQRRLEELVRELQRQMEDAARRDLTTPELLDRMEQLAEELARTRDRRLQELQQQLQDALQRQQRAGGEQGDPRLADLVDRLRQRQREVLDRMERARSLMSELQQEQQMAGLASTLEELLRRQQALRDAAERPRSAAEAAEQARQQEALAAQLEALERQMRQALEQLGEPRPGEQPTPAEQQMRQALQEALAELERERPDERMRQAAGKMQSGGESPPDAAAAQREALRSLASLYHIVVKGQQAMQMAMQQYAAETLRRLAFSLLTLSRRQEELAARIPDDLHTTRRPELPRQQKRILRHVVALREDLGSAVGASAKVPFRLLQQLDRVADQLDGALRNLTGGWGSQARNDARRGLGQINQLVTNMLTSAQMTGSGGQGSQQLPQLAQQLQQMSQQQAALNAATEALQRKLSEQATEQLRASMQRLQSQQQGLAGAARAADELKRSLPDGERLLGDLERLAQEMESVARALGAGEVDEQTLRRQERILGRLLDAQHSVRQKDFERRRRGEAARQPLARQQGRADNGDPGRQGRLLRAARLQQVPQQYRDLVRQYYRAVGRWLTGDREVPRP